MVRVGFDLGQYGGGGVDAGLEVFGQFTGGRLQLGKDGRDLLDDASAAAMNTTLGLVINTNVQAYDAGVQSISGLTTDANTMITAMEGMSFDTPKGKMTFRKEDHQAMQSMYHFKIKVDPAFAWGVPELVREIKPEEMNVPIRNKR